MPPGLRLFLCLLLLGAAVCSAQQPSAAVASKYTLSPEQFAQSIAYARSLHQLYFLRLAYGVAALLLLLRFRVAPRFRDWAETLASTRFWQAMLFVAAIQFSFDVLGLPGDVAAQWLRRNFGQSSLGWGLWLSDRAKGELTSITAEVFLVWLLYAVIRRWPQRWWLYSWLGALPAIVFSIVLNPLVVDPLFFNYTPLAESQPELSHQIERVIERSGEPIPEDRIFLMDASRKLNGLNAGMTGLGSSRRVVVWDTIVARMSTPQILFVFGHELGHYTLGHVFQDLLFSAALLLFSLWAGSHLIGWALLRYGDAWGVRGAGDWASFPVLLILILLFGFASAPPMNAFGRYLEHQADQYGLEVVHGIVADAPKVSTEVFQMLGETSLEEPAPSWLARMWFYNHPTLSERIQFASTYDPWAHGQSPRYVK